MHSVLLGVTKLLLSLWFSTRNKSAAFYIGRKIALVDKRLLAINSPSLITQKPRKLSEHTFWVLIVFIVLFAASFLPPDYWNRYALLVISIYYLLQKSISEEQLLNSEQMFCSGFKTLCGRRYVTANVHSLLCLADSICELGPLWAHFCFHFESQNGALKSLVHGT